MSTIKGYGVYIPRYRMRFEEFKNAWQTKELIRNTGIALGVPEKAVARFDEDAVTMAVEAGKNAINSAGVAPSDIGALIIGTTSQIYRGNPISTTIAKVLSLSNSVVTVDIDQSSRSGTSALLLGKSMVDAGEVKYALAIGTDRIAAEPGSDPLEPIMGAGAGAVVLGNGDGVAEIKGNQSYAGETFDLWCGPDERFFKIDMDQYRFHYEKAIVASTNMLMAAMGSKPQDYQYVVLQQPNRREVTSVTRSLGISKDQIGPGMAVSETGDTFSASTLIGLAKVLDQAKKGEKILMASYGAGCSQALHLECHVGAGRGTDGATVSDYLGDKILIDYVMYLKFSDLLAGRKGDTDNKPTTIEILTENHLRYHLKGWTCKKCGWITTIEQKICSKCAGQDWDEFALPERGRVDLVSNQQYVPIPIAMENKQEPVVNCTINLGDGLMVASQVVDYEGTKVEEGMEVEAVFRKYKSSPVNVYGYKFRPLRTVS